MDEIFILTALNQMILKFTTPEPKPSVDASPLMQN